MLLQSLLYQPLLPFAGFYTLLHLLLHIIQISTHVQQHVVRKYSIIVQTQLRRGLVELEFLLHGYGIGVEQVHERGVDISGFTDGMVEIEVLWVQLLADKDVVEGRVEVAVVLEAFFFLL